MDKSGPTVPSLDYIVAHYALYDVGKGMVYVVQVVSTAYNFFLTFSLQIRNFEFFYCSERKPPFL